jgi:endonuclease/exonuclease/phosphatase family metal-dependent hydrolase
MRIVSWNIQWGRGADRALDLTRTIALLHSIDADVICLQEVAVNFDGLPGGSTGNQVVMLREAFPDHAAVYGPAVDLGGGPTSPSFGNLILSRSRVVQAWRHLLPWPADGGLPAMQRGCVEVVIEHGAVPLRVLTTHLEYYSPKVRLAQAQRLAALQGEVCALEAAPPRSKKNEGPFSLRPRPSRAVLCGDFNCRPGEAAHQAVQAPAVTDPWSDAWAALNPSAEHPPTVGLHGAEWPDTAYCCDFFFVSQSLLSAVRSVEVESVTAASDHQPVVLELALGGTESGSISAR